MENNNTPHFQVQTEERTHSTKTRKFYSTNLRTRHCSRLRHLLAILIQQRNWTEASGVLSVLLKGTNRETFTQENRDKYLATMEILKKMEGDHIKPRAIRNIYEIWIKKNGAMKKSPLEEKFSAKLEYVLFCLTHDNISEANLTITSLIQETEYGRDPVLNMLAGLIYYELWYTGIPKEMKLKGSDIYAGGMPIEVLDSCNSVESGCSSSVYLPDSKSPAQGGNNKNQYIGSPNDMQAETSQNVLQPQSFYAEDSAEMSGDEQTHHVTNVIDMSIFESCGLEASLLPIRLPEVTENMENSITAYLGMLKDYYPKAVKHLQFSLHSTPPVLASLLPLVQLLLLGGQVEEAVKELESLCESSNAVLPFRIRAMVLECVGSEDSRVKLCSCYEDTMKRDPTCSESLTRLISMHKMGDYSVVALVEMVALHLDATYGSSNIWAELASCFIKLVCDDQEDQVFFCELGGKRRRRSITNNNNNVISNNKSWKLRCRWWRTRHFSKINTETSTRGEDELLTWKAACASHLYGKESEYVVRVHSYLNYKGEEAKRRLLLLQYHINNSINVLSECSKFQVEQDMSSSTGQSFV